MILLPLGPSATSVAASGERPPDFAWALRMGGPDIEVGCGIAADPAGNLFVTGFFSGTTAFGDTSLISSGYEDIFLAKYDPGGRFLWARRAGGAGYDEGRAVAVDTAGHAYVTGLFQGLAGFGGTNLNSSGQSDVFLAKYDPAGNLLWARRAGGSDFDEGYAVALDGADQPCLTGYFNGPAAFGSLPLASLSASNNVFVAKCDRAGNFLWARPAGGDGDGQGNGIAVDASASVFVTGSFAGTITFANTNLSSAGTSGASDIFVAKYDGAGQFLWARQAGGAGGDAGLAIAADRTGNAYVTGRIIGQAAFGSTNVAASGADLFLAKFGSAGDLPWVRKAGGNNAIYGDAGLSVKLDTAGNPCVAGYFSGNANFGVTNLTTTGLDDLFVAKYDGAGNVFWVRKAGGGDLDIAFALDVDRADNICVTGFFVSSATFGDTNLTATRPSPDRDIFLTKLPSPTPPRLTIHLASDTLQLSWPAPAIEYTLETTPSLPTQHWDSLPPSTNVVGPSRLFTLPASAGRGFFRLRKP